MSTNCIVFIEPIPGTIRPPTSPQHVRVMRITGAFIYAPETSHDVSPNHCIFQQNCHASGMCEAPIHRTQGPMTPFVGLPTRAKQMSHSRTRTRTQPTCDGAPSALSPGSRAYLAQLSRVQDGRGTHTPHTGIYDTSRRPTHKCAANEPLSQRTRTQPTRDGASSAFSGSQPLPSKRGESWAPHGSRQSQKTALVPQATWLVEWRGGSRHGLGWTWAGAALSSTSGPRPLLPGVPWRRGRLHDREKCLQGDHRLGRGRRPRW